MSVNCIVNQTGRLSDPTKKLRLDEPLAYSNNRAHAMRFTVVSEDSDEPADLTGVGVTGQFIRYGSNPVDTVSPINGTVTGNVCEVILPASCYAVPGRYRFTMDIAVSGDNPENRTVLWVEGIVERNTTEAVVDPGTPVPNITAAINNANAAAEDANSAAEAARQAAQEATGAVSYETQTGKTDAQKATARTNIGAASEGDVSDLKNHMLLEQNEIPDTVQSIAFDGSGNVQNITHKKRTDQSVTVRTDTFTFGDGTITEVRTLNTGESLTIVTDTDTLVTTLTYAAA